MTESQGAERAAILSRDTLIMVAVAGLALGLGYLGGGLVRRPPAPAMPAVPAELSEADDTATVEALIATVSRPPVGGDTGGIAVGAVRSDVASIGEPAPPFDLPALGGGTISLSDYTGQPVALNFFATWCAPCRVEMPFLEAAYQRHGPSGLVILGVDVQESEDMVAAFMQELNLTFPAVLDVEGRLLHSYGVGSLPTTVLISIDGEVATIRRGLYSSEADLEKELRFILADTEG
jgi:peroxiredoxin